MKHVYMVAIVPRAAHDPAQAVANLIAYYDHDPMGRRDHKRYLTKDELVAHLFEDLWQVGLSREDIPSHPYLQDLDDWLAQYYEGLLDGSYYDDFEIIDELYEDKYGIYVLSDIPLEVGWIGWHIGGRWEAAVSGVQPTTEAKCLCTSLEEHVQLNSCPVAELSLAVLPELLITPDAAWYSRKDSSAMDWKEIIQAAMRRFQDDLAIGVDCCIPFPETEDVPLAEEEAWERDREADLTNPIEHLFPVQFPSGLPPYLSNQVRLFFRYVGFLRRLRLRLHTEDEILVTAHDWLNEWLHLCEFDISQAKQKRYELTIRQFLSWYEAKTQQPLTLREITPDLVTSYSFMLQRKVRVGTVMYHLRVLRKWCTWLMPRGEFSAETVRHLGFLIEELERSRCRQIS